MEKQIRAMMIGAHPDDCDFRYGGIALKYAALGHKVKFLAMVNGCGGHHEMKPAEIAARRKKETEVEKRRFSPLLSHQAACKKALPKSEGLFRFTKSA